MKPVMTATISPSRASRSQRKRSRNYSTTSQLNGDLANIRRKLNRDAIGARIGEIVKNALVKRGITLQNVVKTEVNNGSEDGCRKQNVPKKNSSIVKKYREFCAATKKPVRRRRKTGVRGEDNNVVDSRGKWKCDVCDVEFSRESKLLGHKKTNHVSWPWWAGDDDDAESDCDVMKALTNQNEGLEVSSFIKTEDGTFAIESVQGQDDCSSSEDETHKKGRRSENVCKVVVRTEIPESTKKNENGLWPCHLCEKKEFITRQNLRNHLMIHHTGEKPYECDFCQTRFQSQATLKVHRRTHTGEKPYKCDQCDKAFHQATHLRSHKRTHTGEQPYQCDVCQRRFSQKSAMVSHRRIHTGEKPYKCEQCHKSFREMCKLKVHLVQKHSNELRYACDECDARFKVKSAVSTHKRRVHKKEKNHHCDYCDKVYFSRSELLGHVRIHTEEKPFECSVCSRTFRLNVSLSAHMKVHTGEKPYACDMCEYRGTQHHHLVVHRRIHNGEKPFTCDICPHAFRCGSALTKHKEDHKNAKFTCPLCSRPYNRLLGLIHHERSHRQHPVVCDVCRKGFIGTRSLREHRCVDSQGRVIQEECGEDLSEDADEESYLYLESTGSRTSLRRARKVIRENEVEQAVRNIR